MDEIKNCPFCDGEAFTDETVLKHGRTYSVYCEKCGAEIARFDMEEAIESWNGRV